jgi:hypothetical protein
MNHTQNMAELLLGEASRAIAAAERLTAEAAWGETVALAARWKVVPQLLARIQSLRIALPGEETRALRREFLRAYGQSSSRAERTALAMRALEQAGIAVAAFKGVAAMAVLYGGPKQRSIGDGDLLITRKDIAAAVECVERIGFRRKGEETLAEYLGFVENAPRFAGNEALALYGEDGSEIDLHWSLAGSGLPVEEILERAEKAGLLGAPIPVVDAADGLLLTIHHAIREDLALESICRDLLDARLWCERLEQRGEFEAAIRRAATAGSRAALLSVCSLLGSYDDASAAARLAQLLGAAASRSERQSARRLTELFHYQMERGRLQKDVLLLVHSRPWRQILRGLASDWTGYRRSMQTLEEQLGEEQPLHTRLAMLAHSIPGPQGIRLARELARVKYRREE